MIAFDFNICFNDEPSLDDGLYRDTKESISLFKSDDPALFEQLVVKSEYMPLSGREACYGAMQRYSECETGCLWGVDVKDLVQFVWRRGEHSIYYHTEERCTPELLQFWTLHTIIPMMLSLDQTYSILHVGAVTIGDAAIIFSADSFGGKSTLTDYFLRKGHRLLSDDTLGVYEDENRFLAVASYPFHRPFRSAESLGYKVSEVVETPKVIKAVYLLERADAKAAVAISEVQGVEKYKALHFSTFIDFDFLKKSTFSKMSAFVNVTPVYRVTVPWEIVRLEAVYKSICKHSGVTESAP